MRTCLQFQSMNEKQVLMLFLKEDDRQQLKENLFNQQNQIQKNDSQQQQQQKKIITDEKKTFIQLEPIKLESQEYFPSRAKFQQQKIPILSSRESNSNNVSPSNSLFRLNLKNKSSKFNMTSPRNLQRSANFTPKNFHKQNLESLQKQYVQQLQQYEIPPLIQFLTKLTLQEKESKKKEEIKQLNNYFNHWKFFQKIYRQLLDKEKQKEFCDQLNIHYFKSYTILPTGNYNLSIRGSLYLLGKQKLSVEQLNQLEQHLREQKEEFCYSTEVKKKELQREYQELTFDIQKKLNSYKPQNNELPKEYFKRILPYLKIVKIINPGEQFQDIITNNKQLLPFNFICIPGTTIVSFSKQSQEMNVKELKEKFDNEIYNLQFPFLKELSLKQLKTIIPKFKIIQTNNNQIIYCEAMLDSKLYFILEGQFELMKYQKHDSHQKAFQIPFPSEINIINDSINSNN